MNTPLGKAWNRYWRSTGFVGSGEHLVPDVERHHPIRIIGGGHHGRQTVRRDLQHYRVALVAGEFIMVPDDWAPGTEVVEITKLRIMGRSVGVFYGVDLSAQHDTTVVVRVGP